MKPDVRVLTATAALLAAISVNEPAFAQKSGGTLKISFFDNPAPLRYLPGWPLRVVQTAIKLTATLYRRTPGTLNRKRQLE